MDRFMQQHAEPMLAMLAFIGFVVWCINMVP